MAGSRFIPSLGAFSLVSLWILLSLSFPISAGAQSTAKIVVAPKVLVLNFDPIIKSEGGKRLHEVAKWNDSRYLAAAYASDLKECSGGFVRYKIVEWKDIDAWPLKKDGFRYSEDEFLACMRSGKGWHQADAVDPDALIRDYALDKRVSSGEIDEVWMFAMPYSGTWESTMAGKGAYFCNSDPIPNVKCPRIFVIMGFNYERGVGEMLEDQGHRTESIMTHVYGSWEPKPTQPGTDSQFGTRTFRAEARRAMFTSPQTAPRTTNGEIRST